MSGQFKSLFSREVNALVAARSCNRVVSDTHLHFCDIDARVEWNEVLLSEVLSVLTDRTRAFGLVPAILFQSAREQLHRRLPDTVKDLLLLLAQRSEDPAAVYLFEPSDTPFGKATIANGLTNALTIIHPQWMALLELIDASSWDGVNPEHANLILTTRSSQQ